jgi:hypothetical protein
MIQPLEKPHISLRRYVKGSYNVLVCTTDGEVFFTWTGKHRQTAYRMSHQVSPSMDQRTYRCVVVRPGTDLLLHVNWVINGWQPPSTPARRLAARTGES